jgi:hypothetical protein
MKLSKSILNPSGQMCRLWILQWRLYNIWRMNKNIHPSLFNSLEYCVIICRNYLNLALCYAYVSCFLEYV